MVRHKPRSLQAPTGVEKHRSSSAGLQAAGLSAVFLGQHGRERAGAGPSRALKASVTEGRSSLTRAHPAAARLSRARTRFLGHQSSAPFY